jgi:hypothetical protein
MTALAFTGRVLIVAVVAALVYVILFATYGEDGAAPLEPPTYHPGGGVFPDTWSCGPNLHYTENPGYCPRQP